MEPEQENQSKPSEEEVPRPPATLLTPSFPQGKIKRIMKLDRDIKKATAEATFAISLTTELFIKSLAARSHAEMSRRGHRIVRGEHVRSAARAHQPTDDFLLGCLSQPISSSSRQSAGAMSQTEGEGLEKDNEKEKEKEKGKAKEKEKEKPLPRGAQRIDKFFQKAPVDSDSIPAK